MPGIKVAVLHGDAFNIKADTLVLKYAQTPFGLDRDVIREFEIMGFQIANKLPRIWEYFLTNSQKITHTEHIIFIGTPPLMKFEYKEIREFGKKSMISLASSAPKTKSIVMTIHGPGYGLDEIEAFESQLAGIIESISFGDYPDALEAITFVERSKGRSDRLQNVLTKLLPFGYIPTVKSENFGAINRESAATLRSAGHNSESKKNVFVAMPFSSEFEDIYHYGIYGAVNSLGYICERADQQIFTGDVMEWVKNRISNACIVVADLSTSNPNVYLEIGYAWGVNKKTVLLIKDPQELKFDTRAQKCLPYSNIKDLEMKLKKTLSELGI